MCEGFHYNIVDNRQICAQGEHNPAAEFTEHMPGAMTTDDTQPCPHA